PYQGLTSQFPALFGGNTGCNRLWFTVGHLLVLHLRREFPFTQDGLHPRNVFAQTANFLQALCLAHAELKLQAEKLIIQIALLLFELSVRLVANFFALHNLNLAFNSACLSEALMS